MVQIDSNASHAVGGRFADYEIERAVPVPIVERRRAVRVGLGDGFGERDEVEDAVPRRDGGAAQRVSGEVKDSRRIDEQRNLRRCDAVFDRKR